MTDLITALEQASGPSRELDARIALATGWSVERETTRETWTTPSGNRCLNPAPFSSSLDAALTLVPEGWALKDLGEQFIYGGPPRIETWYAELHNRGEMIMNRDVDGFANTPALALCTAAMRAREVGNG